MMEKGSERILPSHTDEKVKGIPLPSQMPKGIDFSELPLEALKSSTIEGLISQNEDLMARLSVSLRKIHELEENTALFEKEKKTFHARFQALREQYLILQEKDKTSTHRTLSQQQETSHLRQSGERLEKLYTDLYGQAQALQQRLVRLERYRTRVKRAAPRIQTRSKRIESLENDIVEHRRTLHAEKIALAEELTNRITDLEARLQQTQEDSRQSYNSLLAQHSLEIEAVQAQLRDYEREKVDLKIKADERDKLYQDLLKLENQRIFDQRQFEQIRAENEQIKGRLETETISLRQQLKDLLVDREAKVQELERLTSEIPNLRERNQNLVEQVESLQSLWNHKQREVEQAVEKNKSLQKLNQSLSLTMNQQRKEIHALQVELDKERFAAQEKVKTLVTEIQLLRAQVPEKL